MISSIVNDSISFLLSLIVLSYCLYTLDFISIVGCFLAVIIPMLIKAITRNTPFPGIFKRPDGAKDCNLFNTGGVCDRESGFPSGHVTLIAYFCFYIYFQYNKELKEYLFGDDTKREYKSTQYSSQDLYLLILCFIPTIMMGYAIYMKNCHNMIQVTAGAITGFAISRFIIKLR